VRVREHTRWNHGKPFGLVAARADASVRRVIDCA